MTLALTSVYVFARSSDSNPPILDILIVLIFASAGAASGGIARFTFWWVKHLPERVLGAFGLVLALIGIILPVAPPLFNILKAIGKLN